MTMFRCAEDQSRTGIHNTLEFLQVMVGNAVEETVAIVCSLLHCRLQRKVKITEECFAHYFEYISIYLPNVNM